jgi:hypothetical protein
MVQFAWSKYHGCDRLLGTVLKYGEEAQRFFGAIHRARTLEGEHRCVSAGQARITWLSKSVVARFHDSSSRDLSFPVHQRLISL